MCTKHLIPVPNLSESEIKGVCNHKVYSQPKLVRDQDLLSSQIQQTIIKDQEMSLLIQENIKMI
jgi:hypothetical protein